MAATIITQPRPATATTTYFAYGSNMHAVRMADRCPRADFLGVAQLRGWAVRIDARGVATIDRADEATTYGLLWTLTPGDEAALDRYEGVRSGYYRRETLTVDGPGGPTAALVYIGADLGRGPARTGYLELILEGAAVAGIPASYLAVLAGLAGLDAAQ